MANTDKIPSSLIDNDTKGALHRNQVIKEAAKTPESALKKVNEANCESRFLKSQLLLFSKQLGASLKTLMLECDKTEDETLKSSIF